MQNSCLHEQYKQAAKLEAELSSKKTVTSTMKLYIFNIGKRARKMWRTGRKLLHISMFDFLVILYLYFQFWIFGNLHFVLPKIVKVSSNIFF